MYQRGFVQNQGHSGHPQESMGDASLPMCGNHHNDINSTQVSSQSLLYGHPQLYSSGVNQFARRPLQPVQLPSNDSVLSQYSPSPKPLHLHAGAFQHSQQDYYELPLQAAASQRQAGDMRRFLPEPMDYMVDPHQGYAPRTPAFHHQDPRESFYREEPDGHFMAPAFRSQGFVGPRPPMAQELYSPYQPQRTSSYHGDAGVHDHRAQGLPGLTAGPPPEAPSAAATTSSYFGPVFNPPSEAAAGAVRPQLPGPPATATPQLPRPPATPQLPRPPATPQLPRLTAKPQLNPPTSDRGRDHPAARAVAKPPPVQDDGLRVLTGTVDQILTWGRKVEEAVRPDLLFEIIGSLDGVRRGPHQGCYLVSLRAMEGGATLQGVFWEMDRALPALDPGSIVSCVCRLGPKALASSHTSLRVQRPQLPRLQVLKVRRVLSHQLHHLKRISYASSHAVQQGALQQQQQQQEQPQDNKKQALISSYMKPEAAKLK